MMMMNKKEESVKVVVRIRPMSDQETRSGCISIAEAYPDQGLIEVRGPKGRESEPPKTFSFDAVFDDNVEQKFIYDSCAASIVESVLNGYNGTIFAYGQTGAGKTHTMEGRTDPAQLRGIIPNSFQHIFDYIATNTAEQQFLVRASYLEIYMEEIHDLLSKDPKANLQLKDNLDSGVYVKDLTSYIVKNVAEIDHLLQKGKRYRSQGKTLMNDVSSRSHAIFTIVIESMDCSSIVSIATDNQSTNNTNNNHIRVGKLNLVDLAGSERQSKTGATGSTLQEGNKINWSLHALGNVIAALADGKSSFVPYRNSKLTRLLQNSLGGNAKTVMCANCSPADYNYDETLSTLRYANHVKNVKNKPKINQDPKDAVLKEYQDEIKRLKEQLAATQQQQQQQAGAAMSGTFSGINNEADAKQLEIRQEIIEKIVEREVIKEVKVGLSDQEMEEILHKANEEKQLLLRQAQENMMTLIDQHSRTAQERAELQAALEKEAEDRKLVETQKQKLQKRLKKMEEQLLKGGEVISKAAQQEAALRKAEIDLRERQAEEARLARELAIKEESALLLEEHYNSLQEEVEVKTKKLKKLWSKYHASQQEAQDLQHEFQSERSNFLDTIRQLTGTIKLKDQIIDNFIPENYAKNIESRCIWDDDEDRWTVQRVDLAGNNMRYLLRPISSSKLRRPETEFARQRKQYDPNPRYRCENIISIGLDLPDKTTQIFEGPGMVSNVDPILRMNLNANNDDTNGDEVIIFADEGIVYPYLQYSDNAHAKSTQEPYSGAIAVPTAVASTATAAKRPTTKTGTNKGLSESSMKSADSYHYDGKYSASTSRLAHLDDAKDIHHSSSKSSRK